MKKKLIYVLGYIILVSSQSYAQTGSVGINTKTPKAALDVRGSNTVPSGILIPASLAEMIDGSKYGSDQDGTLVYCNDLSFATGVNDVSAVTATGFYFYDASQTKWIPAGGVAVKNNAWERNGDVSTNSGEYDYGYQKVISDAENFVGTTDNEDLIIKTNGIEVLRVSSKDNEPEGFTLDTTNIGHLFASSDIFVGRSRIGNGNSWGGQAFGSRALHNNIEQAGWFNTAIGEEAMFSNVDGTYNIAIGYQALTSNVSGTGNIALGTISSQYNNGNYNTSIGHNSLIAATYSEGEYVLGTRDNNVVVGANAVSFLDSGSNNIGIGFLAMDYLFKGSYNIGIGNGIEGYSSHDRVVNNTILIANKHLTPPNDVTSGGGSVQIGGNVNPGPGTNSVLIGNGVGENFLTIDSSGDMTLMRNSFEIKKNTNLTVTGLRERISDSLLQFTINSSLVADANGKIISVNPDRIYWKLGGNETLKTNYIGSNSLNQVDFGVSGPLNPPVMSMIPSVASNYIDKLDYLSVANNMYVDSIRIGSGFGEIPINTNTVVGYSSLEINTSGYNNTGIGYNTLKSNTTGYDNTAVGVNALAENTSARNNTAVGFNALAISTTGFNNTAIGSFALSNNNTGSNNIAVGYNALLNNTTQIYNTAVGVNALMNSVASATVAVGYNALTKNTTGTGNTAIGTSSLTNNIIGNFNTAVGSYSLTNTNADANTSIGYYSLYSNTTGANNTSIGYYSLYSNTTGKSNLGIGYNALKLNTIGSSNTGLGTSALINNVNGNNNLAVGVNSSSSNTSGSNNVAIGTGSLAGNKIGSSNTSVGAFSMASVTTSGNTAVGYGAINAATTSSGNTSIGAYSMYLNTSGNNNTIMGFNAVKNNTSSENTVIGSNAMFMNTTGNFNVLLGSTVLYDNIDGIYNTMVGSHAGEKMKNGDYNIAIGANVMKTSTGGIANIIIGNNSFTNSSSSNGNIIIGNTSGNSITPDGSGNVIIGSLNPINNTDPNNIVYVGTGGGKTGGDGIEIMRMSGNNSKIGVAIGYGSSSLLDGTYMLDVNGNTRIEGDLDALRVLAGGVDVTSDKRLKKNIKEIPHSIETLMKLNPVIYDKKLTIESIDYQNKNEMGFIAQEVQEVLPNIVEVGKDKDKTLSLNYIQLIPVLTRALQEEEIKINKLNEKIAKQDEQIELLIKMVEKLTQR